MCFVGDLNRFNERTRNRMETAFRKVAFDLSEMVIKGTPVDEGRLKGNWQVGINAAPRGEVSMKDATKKGSWGSAAIGVKEGVSRYNVGDTYYLINNLPYAGVVENGSSQQAPQGMVGVALTKFRPILAKAIKQA